MQTYQYIKSHYPKKILSSGSLGVMGAGLPYGIGAKIANPNKMVFVIDGDSSFNMTLSDLKTVIEQKLPIKIAIILGIFLWTSILSSKDLNFKSSITPAKVKIIKSRISKKSLSIDRDPPINAKGIDDIK